MRRSLLLIFISSLLAVPGYAQPRVPAPPSPDEEPEEPRRKPRRAPPTPDRRPVRQAQVLKNFVPDTGPAGTVVTVEGDNFDDTCGVRFNGRMLKIVERTPTRIRFKIPQRAVTDNLVVTKAGFRDDAFDRPFHVVRKPLIRTFKPRKAGPGEKVVIVGEHFLPSDRFYIGPRAMDVVKFRARRVTVRIPPGALSYRLHVKRDGVLQAKSKHPIQIVGPPPVIEGFEPDRGSAGTVVRINGLNFEPPDKVSLKGKAVAIRKRGRTFLEVEIGRGHTTGRFMIKGLFARKTRSRDVFTVLRPPKVARFKPNFGVPGTVITLFGTGFQEGDQVRVGDALLTVRTVSHNRVVAELPAGVESGRISISRGDKRFVARGRFEVIQAPEILDVSPMEGPPGSKVTIRGKYFLRGFGVLLGGRKLPVARGATNEQTQVTIPQGARSGRLVVVTRAGSVRSPGIFRVTKFATLASFYPMHGLPGTRVTVRGQHFHPGVKAFIGGRELPVTDIRPNQVMVEIPEGTPSGKIVVHSWGRKLVSRIPFTVDQPKPEVAFTFHPKKGRRGSEVTLVLDPPRMSALVLFNDRPLPKKTLQGGRRIVVTIPGDARSGHFEVEYNGRRYRARDAKPFKVR